MGAQALEGEGGLRLGAGLGEGLPHQTEVEGARAEQAWKEAELAEFGEERAVDVPGFALLREGTQPVHGQGAQLRGPGGL